MAKSTDQVRADFEARGETLKEWATRRGYTPRLVYAVMAGQVKAKRGTSHHIAVELGLKDAPKAKALL